MLTFPLILIFAKYISAQNDKYVLNFDSPIYVCADEDSESFADTSEMEVKRLNETTVITTGDMKIMKKITEKTMVEFIVEKDMSGSFEILLTREICDLCKELGDPESFYYEYLKIFGFPDECPVEPDTYHVNDFVANTKDFPINKEHEGRYQVTLNVYQNPSGDCRNDKEFVGCFKLDVLVEPME